MEYSGRHGKNVWMREQLLAVIIQFHDYKSRRIWLFICFVEGRVIRDYISNNLPLYMVQYLSSLKWQAEKFIVQNICHRRPYNDYRDLLVSVICFFFVCTICHFFQNRQVRHYVLILAKFLPYVLRGSEKWSKMLLDAEAVRSPTDANLSQFS